ncbi:MAG: hypothetical protein JXQ83_14685, partial [Candidatus Glassbacteria bacterium]|nr:hypothetical protein [Candidatus Glassbacteria bacterium]
MSRKQSILFFAAVLLAAGAEAFAIEGAGPPDVYGGPSENRNVCTPYHFIPQDRLSLSYDWKPGPNLLELEPQNVAYWTQGNNISQSISASGNYLVVGGGWQQGKLACIYPRGSAYKMVRSQCIFEHAIGEFNGRELKDTVLARYLGSNDKAGRISTDLGYREDLEPWADKYTGKTDRVHVSTRPSDLAEWPEEFCDENGEPIIISDEDVVVVHYIPGYAQWESGREQQDFGGAPFVEMQGRVMSFSASVARDIQFYDYKLINKSQFHFFPDIGPYDLEEYMYGPGAIFDMGDQTGGQKVAFIPGVHLGFTWEETFTDPAISPPSPMGGYVVVRRLETRDPETGEWEEGKLVSFSMNVSGGSWGYYHDEMSSTQSWKVCLGDPKFLYLQDPGPGDDPESRLPVISRSGGSEFHFRYYSDNPLCPGDTAYFAYALVCAFPSVGDPASTATSPEGLAQVAAQLVQNAEMAHSLYASGFKMPRPPKAPNLRLIPGDHQVTITWDNLSEFSRDDFYDQYGGANDYREHDFEGYRVYRSTTGEANDAQLLAQFDLKNGIVLATGIKNEEVQILDEDGNEVPAVTTTYTDT